ncbi:helix-turn-helix domain-containing protein [Frankia sp. CiP3]|uniref:AlbA family DNA-binding domain-containing protein n=1 Tax=Frankia sp. CiP3 TaxID=2880971 RepID=UPI001EF73D71|nr:ATP-binding protein [Frankia sp. CiP3]
MIAFLRAAGGDTTEVEVKSAAGGLPASLTSTLSALANQPGGGTLDERAGFRPVELSDPQILKQGLAARARAFTPPVRLTIDDGEVDGAAVVVAQVHECDRSTKPCRVTATGRAYLRGYDGDYALSDVEGGIKRSRRHPTQGGRCTDRWRPPSIAGRHGLHGWGSLIAQLPSTLLVGAVPSSRGCGATPPA